MHNLLCEFDREEIRWNFSGTPHKKRAQLWIRRHIKATSKRQTFLEFPSGASGICPNINIKPCPAEIIENTRLSIKVPGLMVQLSIFQSYKLLIISKDSGLELRKNENCFPSFVFTHQKTQNNKIYSPIILDTYKKSSPPPISPEKGGSKHGSF